MGVASGLSGQNLMIPLGILTFPHHWVEWTSVKEENNSIINGITTDGEGVIFTRQNLFTILVYPTKYALINF